MYIFFITITVFPIFLIDQNPRTDQTPSRPLLSNKRMYFAALPQHRAVVNTIDIDLTLKSMVNTHTCEHLSPGGGGEK